MLALFRQQVETLLQRGAQRMCGLSDERFIRLCEPLSNLLGEIPEETRRAEAPFVICFGAGLLPIEKQMSLVRINDKPGTVNVHDLREVFNPDPINKHPFPYLAVGVQLGDRRKRSRRTEERRTHHELARVADVIGVGVHFPQLIPVDRPIEIVSGGYQGSNKMIALEIRSSINKFVNQSWCLTWSFHDQQFHYAATCEKRLYLPGFEPEHLAAYDATIAQTRPDLAIRV